MRVAKRGRNGRHSQTSNGPLTFRCKKGESEPSLQPQPDGDWRVDERKPKKGGVVGFVIALARLHVPYRGPAWGCIARADEQTESN